MMITPKLPFSCHEIVHRVFMDFLFLRDEITHYTDLILIQHISFRTMEQEREKLLKTTNLVSFGKQIFFRE